MAPRMGMAEGGIVPPANSNYTYGGMVGYADGGEVEGEDVSTPEINIQVTEDEKFDLVAQLQKSHFPTGKVSTIDGIRVDYEDGWGLVRASNTTPVLVLRFEGESQAVLQRIKDEFQRHLYAVDAKLTVPDYPL